MTEKKKDLVEIRKQIFKKIMELKRDQKEGLRKIRNQMNQLEGQNIQARGFAKLTKKTIESIQKQRSKNLIVIKSDFGKLEKITKKITLLEISFLKMNEKK